MTENWRVRLRVNGQAVELRVPPLATLAQMLREYLGLRGTKIACNKGECGTCTVIMNGRAVNSCLVLAPQTEGAEVWTIEGVGTDDHLHPLQQALLREGAIQCGYCTPGIIMSGIALLRQTSDPTKEQIEQAVAGNLCRCTGYQKIVRAIESCAEEIKRSGGAA